MDWTQGFSVSYDFALVDRETWSESGMLDSVTDCTITKDSTTDLLESASLTINEPIAETYVRVYLRAKQDGATERIALGTFLVQTPSVKYDGKVGSRDVDAYSVLQPMKDRLAGYGLTARKGANVVAYAISMVESVCAAPVSRIADSTTLLANVVAEDGDTMLAFAQKLLKAAGLHFSIQGDGTILFARDKDASSMAPQWTFSVDDKSIIKADLTDETDWYGLPNHAEVVYSKDAITLIGVAENNDANSPISIASRGRRVDVRDTSPNLPANATQADVDALALKNLRAASSVARTLTYSHGYCPLRLNDCVRLVNRKFGLDTRAVVQKQSIACKTGLSVDETATWNINEWSA